MKSTREREAGDWGTREWFDAKAGTTTGSVDGYYSHAINPYQRHRHGQIVAFARRHIDGANGLILDVGCGGGELLDGLVRGTHAAAGLGVDFSAPVVARAAERFPDLTFEIGALPDLPQRAHRWDLIVASEVLYYLSEQALDAALANIRENLAPQGLFLFTSALGGRYFSEQGALAILSRRFEPVEVGFTFSKLYKRLTRPADLALKLDRALRDRAADERMDFPAPRWVEALARTWPGNAGLRLACHVAKRILWNEWLPGACAQIARLLPGDWKGNIIVLARPSGDAC